MDSPTTPPPLTHFTSSESTGGGRSSLHSSTPAPWRTSPLVTTIGPKGGASSAEDIIAMAVGISCAVLLVFVCLIAVLLWCLSRRNGWYITNEKDEDDEDDDEDEDEDNKRVSADTALRRKQEEDD